MYSQIAQNKRRSWVMLFVFTLLAAGMAWIFGKYMGSMPITIGVLIGAIAYAAFGYFAGGKMSLAVNGAKEIQKRDNPRLYRIVENLAITEGLPMPKVYIMDDPAMNAFATGRDPRHSAVAVTTGLLDVLDDDELKGVMAHELGHVKNYDIRVSMLAFALTAVIAVIADTIMHMVWFRNDRENNQLFFFLGIAAAILAPIIATLIQLSISRRREYLADATGALTTRYPEGLASALEKIGGQGGVMRKQNTSTAHLFFANPLKGKGIANLFSTHPPIQERIKRLRSMGDHA
jgi:heat shock protein HtpX